MAEKTLKVGVIGTGMIGTTAHIPAWKSMSDAAEIVAVADILEDRAKLVAESEDIPEAYGDWREMLKKVSFDVVCVCTPNAYHKEQTMAALKAGAHVLCEKPIAVCYDDAVEMFDAADAAGRVLFVGQTARFSGQSFAAKKIVDSGALGEVYYAETSFMRRRGIPMWGQFHMKEHSGAGPLYDLGVHMIDLLMWILSNPNVDAVSGAKYTKLGNRDEGLEMSLADSGAPIGVLTPRKYSYREFDVEDLATGFMRLEGGATIAVKTSWAANVPENAGHTMILGTEGGLTLDPLTLIRNMQGYQVNTTPKVPADPGVAFSGHWGEVDHLVDVIRGKAECMVTRKQVLNVMSALDALNESAEVGREVLVPEGRKS